MVDWCNLYIGLSHLLFDAPLKWLKMVTLGMSLKVIKLLCVVQGNIRARDSALWQKLLVFDTMTFGAGHDVGGHVNSGSP